MSVTGVQQTTGNASDTQSVGMNRQVDKQEFLMLLVAQLRNQDPTKPMEDREFISQLAQFNTLEQMQAMNKTLSAMSEMSVLGQLASFVGKHVSALTPDGGTVDGVVSGVTILDGTPLLTVNNQQVDVRSVYAIADPSLVAPAPDSGDPPPQQAGGAPPDTEGAGTTPQPQPVG